VYKRQQFRCEFPVSVEWVDPVTKRYRQVRELTSTYRFDTLRGVPREAHITFVLREEQPPPGGFAARRITLDLAWLGREAGGDPRDLRDAAAAVMVVESWVAARRNPPAEAVAKLRSADGPLRGLADSLLARLGGRR